jgi:hypothetical protein
MDVDGWVKEDLDYDTDSVINTEHKRATAPYLHVSLVGVQKAGCQILGDPAVD